MGKSNHRKLSCESLEARNLLAAQPIITEFLANNEGSLLDGNGQPSDWIELFNAGNDSLNLEGFYLSDDVQNLRKWSFPSVELLAGEFLVVFASGSDSTDADGNLHTNFRLDADGEYLSLVEPDGLTVVSQFSPSYPTQRPGVSYGIDQQVSSTKIIDASTPARILVPGVGDAAIGSDWIGRAENEPFDDSEWTAGTAAMGYDAAGTVNPPNLASSGTASQSTTDFNGSADRGVDENLSTFTHTANEADSWWRLEFLEEMNLGRIVLWNRVDCCPERLSNFRVSVFDASDSEVFGQDYYTPEQGGGNPLAGDAVEIQLPPGTSGDTIQVQFRGLNNAGNGWLSLADVEVYESVGYGGLFATDLLSSMKSLNSTVFARVPFDADALTPSDVLKLNVRYDDGFVAYLNGHEIARRNAPISPSWFSSATADRTQTEAMTFEEINLSPFFDLLQPRNNLLSLHGLNDDLDSNDFLLSVELEQFVPSLGRDAFFPTPTPGQFNRDGVTGFVADTTFSIDRGLFGEPFETVVSTATPGATLVYTTDGSRPSPLNGVRVEAAGPEALPTVTIQVDKTTTLRAAAFKDGYWPTNVDTQTYILVEDVLRQPADPVGFPSTWDGRSQNSIRADYEMDPDVVDSPDYRDEIRDGLTSIPTLSIVMNPEDLFGSERGIYINSGQRGRAWEHPTSLEIIQPDGSNFQVDSGIRIHGFSWRFHSNTPKHSFRLEFRDEYGPSKLDYPLFPDAPVEQFDSIVLRAQGGRAWAGRQNPDQAQYIRDVYARDTARDMGKIDGHAAYFQLYLNGLYWGLYHAVERPDSQMAEEYFGGSDEDYDALNRRTTTNEAIDGDLRIYNQMIAQANRGVTTKEAYEEMLRFVDVDNLIDFFLIHQYMTNRDGPETFQSNNQRAIGSRVGDPQFRFFVWDMEYSMWGVTDNINIDVDVPTSASRVYSALRENPEFRLRYADRVHKHLFNDGALTPEKAAGRWQARADEIKTPIIGESARWGDAIRSRPYTRDVEWQRELNRLMDGYFPRRTGILLDQLRNAGLYPSLEAAEFNQSGGSVPPGFDLTMAAPTGTIYYTLDGSDPRAPTDAGQGSLLIPSGSVWKYLDDGSDQGIAWRTAEFDDSLWASGPAVLGYGGSNEATVVNCGPLAPGCSSNNQITTYFRHEFQIDDPSQVGELNVQIKRDDGAVIYINGQEVARTNMPDGPIDASTLAARTGSSRSFVSLKVTPSNLVAGQNVIAVEIHQRSATSDDISFDLEMASSGTAGGMPSDSAQIYSDAIQLSEDVVAKARVLHNGVWSALNEAEFLVGQPADRNNLAITEVHYHPAGDGETEFVELLNVSDGPVTLAGVQFANAFEFDFAEQGVTSIAAGQRLVVVNDFEAFSQLYDVEAIAVAGEFSAGRLSNSSDRIVLLAADGNEILNFTYQDAAPWPTAPDGNGPSLEVVDVSGNYDDASNWRASSVNGGTPGRDSSETEIPGDANRDGVFDSSDLVQVFQAGEYEDQIAGNSTWEEGDWNADGEFDSRDIVVAFQAGAYQQQATPVAVARERRLVTQDDESAKIRPALLLEMPAIEAVFRDFPDQWAAGKLETDVDDQLRVSKPGEQAPARETHWA